MLQASVMEQLMICSLLQGMRRGSSQSKLHFCDNSKLEPSALGRSQLYLVTHTQHKLDLRLL